MESKLENILDNMMQNDQTVGAMLSDNQGLCYGSRGKATSESAGLITAIADQAAKIHPNSNAPVVILESSDTSVSISKFGFYTGAVFQQKSKK